VGSEQAALRSIERVYREHGADFLRLALAQTGDLDHARDAVQEGFARAIRRRSSFRGAGSIEGWLARCVINAAQLSAGGLKLKFSSARSGTTMT
jgi:DNA-directed RNA polymerase specialized sigma24 family protein